MIKKINDKNPIFSSIAYQKDVVPFTLIEVIKSSATLTVSDENNFVFCSVEFPGVPAWIWTIDDINDISFNQLLSWLIRNHENKKEIYFVAKPPIARKILNVFEKKSVVIKNVIQMESFECRHLIPSKNSQVIIVHPNINDINELSKFFQNFETECFNRTLPPKNSFDIAKKFLDNPKAYIIRVNGKAVAMGKSEYETSTNIAINGVYTLPEYRNKGYAGAIVAHLCKLILSEGKIPMLYTDLSNPSSNKAYANVGFVPCGKVDEVYLKWM